MYTGEFETVPLGEAMFGYEMVNRKEFWLKNEKNRYVMDEFGRHKIDWREVDENKLLMWKQWVMTRIGADVYAHKAHYMTDPQYNFIYYDNIMRALESVPGEIYGNELDMHGLRVPKGKFFTKEDMAWIRKFAGTTHFSLFITGLFQSLWGPGGKGLGIG